ncbi:MAG: hypothetical protein IKB20_01425 [Clostridia bacterium]|nr:hypothetical protein [Clostridia bacterium]
MSKSVIFIYKNTNAKQLFGGASFSVNFYTTKQLVKAQHNHELQKNDFLNICIDVAMREIGYLSSGVELIKSMKSQKQEKMC